MPPEAAGTGAGSGMSPRPVLEVINLDKRFPLRAGLFGRGAGWVNAVNGVSFDVRAGAPHDGEMPLVPRLRSGEEVVIGGDFVEKRMAALLSRIPAGARYYVTIDIDGFDPSIAPGTGTPSHGGFLYYEMLELLDGLTKQGTIVGLDLVEVAPDYDHSGTTAILAAQILMNTIGRMLHNRSEDTA